MKKTLLSIGSFICLFIVLSFSANAQKRACHAHENHLRKLDTDPVYKKNQEAIEHQARQLATFRSNMKGKPGGGNGGGDGGGDGGDPVPYVGVINIPVYVHVIYNTAQQNISDAQVQSQIDVLNEDFRKLNSDVNLTPSEFAGLATDSEIEFTLAGITRKSSTKSSWGTRDAMKKSKRGGVDPITPETHMNIWVCNIGQGILGYAQFPGGDPATDGIVVSPQYFGSSDYGSGFYLSAPFDKGRTATHEVGHYLNLRHIWGDGGCTAEDFVDDTPNSDGPNYGCPSYPSAACGTNDMTMNYMDYVDDACMYMFSAGQVDRMRALFASNGARASMVAGSSSNTANTETSLRNSGFEMGLYPNPANNTAIVSLNLPSEVDVMEISLMDMQGKIVATRSLNQVQGYIEEDFNVSSLENGLYLVKISGGAFNATQKLIINK